MESMLPKEKIIISGGSGLLAINWAIQMRNEYSILLLLHNRKIEITGVICKFVNLESVDSIKKTIQEFGPSIFIHTVGLTDVDLCEKDQAKAHHVNVEIANKIAQCCYSMNLKLVHVSTDHLFSGNKPLVDEEAEPDPVNCYGQTKLDAEYKVINENPDSLIVRTNFYGWGSSYRHSFSDFIIDNLRRSKQINLYDDVYYTPIIASELINAAHELVSNNAKGIFNVVGDDRVSKYGFGLAVAKCFDLNVEMIVKDNYQNHSSKIRRPMDMSLSNRKLSDFLNRRIGSVENHIQTLLAQEKSGRAEEIKKI